jgi:hypothetical protein
MWNEAEFTAEFLRAMEQWLIAFLKAHPPVVDAHGAIKWLATKPKKRPKR